MAIYEINFAVMIMQKHAPNKDMASPYTLQQACLIQQLYKSNIKAVNVSFHFPVLFHLHSTALL
jgi:hypothetical protein